MRMHGQRPGSGGVTLIELLVVLALVAVLQTLAAPALSGMADALRLTAGSNTILSSIHLARSEAIKRKARVVLCKSTTGDACASTGGWEQGWIVFHDRNNNATLDSGEEIIQRESALPSHFSLVGNMTVAKYVSYTPSGTTEWTSGAFQAGRLTLCRRSLSSVAARRIIVSGTGRPRIEKTTLSACPA